MKLTVIGNWGAFPEANEACSGYLVSVNNKNILLDCGAGVLSVLANFIKFEELDAVVISHYHADHMSDIYSLQYAQYILTKIGKRKTPLLVYGNDETEVFNSLNYKESCIALLIKEFEENKICGISFKFLRTKHQETTYAMRIESQNKTIVYTSDTGWSDDLTEFAQNADLLICEASLFDNQKGLNEGHLTAGEAGKIAALSRSKNLMLTHFPHLGPLEELKKQAQNQYKWNDIIMAQKGMVINI